MKMMISKYLAALVGATGKTAGADDYSRSVTKITKAVKAVVVAKSKTMTNSLTMTKHVFCVS